LLRKALIRVAKTSQTAGTLCEIALKFFGKSGKIIKKGVYKNYELVYYGNMPELSRFLGMVISIYFDDHNPPHFHVLYNEYEVIIAINDLTILKGSLPSRVLGLAMEWANLHKEELLENWNMVQKDGKYFKIEPLT
jgi:hypothetical protein